MRHTCVTFSEKTVIKSAAPELMRIEVEKTRRAHDIGVQSGFFYVPKLLDYDNQTGAAVFERLQIRPIADAWKAPTRQATMVGRALALIHQELTLPDEMRRPLPPTVAFPGDDVFIHGDLGIRNVCCQSTAPECVIIDWQTTPLYGGSATYGNRYFDVFWFIQNLFFPPKPNLVLRNRTASIADAFLKAYLDSTRKPYDQQKVRQYARQFFGIERWRIKEEVAAQSRGRTRLLLPLAFWQLDQFITTFG